MSEQQREMALKLAILKSDALFNFYRAERLAGADALTANERTHEFSKRFDALPQAEE